MQGAIGVEECRGRDVKSKEDVEWKEAQQMGRERRVKAKGQWGGKVDNKSQVRRSVLLSKYGE